MSCSRIVARAQSRDARRFARAHARQGQRLAQESRNWAGFRAYLEHLWWKAFGKVWKDVGREATRG